MEPIRIDYANVDELPTYVYVLECLDGSLYAGITRNFYRRLKQHTERIGKGSAHTQERGVKSVVQLMLYPDQESAREEESELLEMCNWIDAASVHEMLLRE